MTCGNRPWTFMNLLPITWSVLFKVPCFDRWMFSFKVLPFAPVSSLIEHVRMKPKKWKWRHFDDRKQTSPRQINRRSAEESETWPVRFSRLRFIYSRWWCHHFLFQLPATLRLTSCSICTKLCDRNGLILIATEGNRKGRKRKCVSFFLDQLRQVFLKVAKDGWIPNKT